MSRLPSWVCHCVTVSLCHCIPVNPASALSLRPFPGSSGAAPRVHDGRQQPGHWRARQLFPAHSAGPGVPFCRVRGWYTSSWDSTVQCCVLCTLNTALFVVCATALSNISTTVSGDSLSIPFPPPMCRALCPWLLPSNEKALEVPLAHNGLLKVIVQADPLHLAVRWRSMVLGCVMGSDWMRCMRRVEWKGAMVPLSCWAGVQGDKSEHCVCYLHAEHSDRLNAATRTPAAVACPGSGAGTSTASGAGAGEKRRGPDEHSCSCGIPHASQPAVLGLWCRERRRPELRTPPLLVALTWRSSRCLVHAQ